MKKTILAVAVALSLVGCGRIETGETGVRINWNKSVDTVEVPQGFYMAVFSNVEHYVIKEMPVALDNMKPRAKDNLLLDDLDMTIYYTFRPEAVAEFRIKYAAQSSRDEHGSYWPGYNLVKTLANGSIYDAVSHYNSLTIHTMRQELEEAVKQSLQAELDNHDKGTFIVTRVVVRQVTTDPELNKAIQTAVRVEKEIEAKNKQLDLAKAEARRLAAEADGIANYNTKVNASLTPLLIEAKRVEALHALAQQGTHTVVMPSDSRALINVGK